MFCISFASIRSGNAKLEIKSTKSSLDNLDLFDNVDCYVITGRVIHFEVDAEVELFESRKKKLHNMFVTLQSMIKKGVIDTKGKPVLILSDELISRDAIRRMELQRVPRYCGYYFI